MNCGLLISIIAIIWDTSHPVDRIYVMASTSLLYYTHIRTAFHCSGFIWSLDFAMSSEYLNSAVVHCCGLKRSNSCIIYFFAQKFPSLKLNNNILESIGV